MRRSLSIRLLVGLLLCSVAAIVTVHADEIPWTLRDELERPLDERVRELSRESKVRGEYLGEFTKAGDGYQTVFQTSTAEPGELVVRRSLLTLKPAGGDRWEITDETPEPEIRGLFHRPIPGDETFYEFSLFAFDAEGFRVSGDRGTMYVENLRGKPHRLVLRASELKHRFSPPEDVACSEVYPAFRKRFGGNVSFTPEEVSIRCSESECASLLDGGFSGLEEISVDSLGADLAKSYKETLAETAERRGESPMADFRPSDDPGHRYWSVAVKKKGEDHSVHFDYDNHASREVRLSLPGVGPLYAYHSEETRRSGKPARQLELRPELDRRDFETVSLTGKMSLAVENPSTISADLTYRLRILQPLRLLPFDIAQVRAFKSEEADSKDPALRIDLLEDGSGEPMTFVRLGGTDGYVVLPEPLSPGDELVVHLKYTHENAIYALNTYYSYVSRSGWLPFIKFGDFIDEYDLQVTTPKKYQILGVGQVAEDEIGKDTHTTRFSADSPVQFPTVIFGKYTSDHSKIKVARRDGTDVPVNIYVDGYSMSSAMWDIRVNALRPIADQAANSLNLFQEMLGVDYPHRKLDLVNAVFQDPYGGQSPASIVYLGGAVFRGAEVIQAQYQAGEISKFLDTVVAHEVAHQWWGGSVAHHSMEHYWFVESLAEYMAALYAEQVYSAKSAAQGWSEYLDKVEGWRRNILSNDLMASVQDADTMWPGPSSWRARQSLIYNYGPYAFHMLRMTFRDYRGQAGDDKFFNFLKTLATQLQGKEVVTRDIQMIAEQAFGGVDPQGEPYTVDLEWFFDQWIRGVGIPELSVEYRVRRAEDGNFIVEGQIAQRIVVGKEREPIPGKTFRGLAVVTAVAADDQVFAVPVPLNDPMTPFAFKVPLEPKNVVLNRNGEILSHDVAVAKLR